MSIPDEKSRLRREIKSRRSCIPENERHDASDALCQRLLSFLKKQHVQRIAVYLAAPTEISLDPLIMALLESGVEISAPRVNLLSHTMAFYRLSCLGEVEVGPYKLREPTNSEEIIPSLLLVPGLAFDERGQRLGMGAGWYDRFLSPHMTMIGVCYDWQILPHIPTESHDQPMDWIFSDKKQLGPFRLQGPLSPIT